MSEVATKIESAKTVKTEVATLKIKPVAKEMFKGLAINLPEVARVKGAGTLYIADRINPEGTTTRVIIVQGEATPSVKPRKGAVFAARHALSGRKYGAHTIVDTLKFSHRNGELVLAHWDGNLKADSDEYKNVVEQRATVFELA